MPYFVAGHGRGLADDELDDERRGHGDGDGAAEQGGGKAGEFLEDGRHPEVEAPEANDPEEVDQAELEHFGIMESLKDGVFFAGLHAGLFLLELPGQIFLFHVAQPADLIRAVLDAEEEEHGKGQRGNGFEDEEFLPAVHAEEGSFEQYAGDRRADDVREQQAGEHQAGRPGALTGCEPAREKHRVDDRVQAGFRCAEQETAEEELEFCRDEGHAYADQPPGEHDAGNPFRRGEFCRDKRAGNLKKQIADEENAGAHAEYFRCNPRQVLRHGELGVGDVYAVDAGDDGYQKYRQDDAQVAPPFQAGKVKLFHK